jgi:hypothetical protein
MPFNIYTRPYCNVGGSLSVRHGEVLLRHIGYQRLRYLPSSRQSPGPGVRSSSSSPCKPWMNNRSGRNVAQESALTCIPR